MPLGHFVHISVIAALLLVSVSGCANVSNTIEKSLSDPVAPEEEAHMSDIEHNRVLAMYGGIYQDDNLLTYVEAIGKGLVKANDFDVKYYTFTVLNSQAVNAFALPGGYVYITRGLLALVEDEAELASILAHEIAHIAARHTSARYKRSDTASISFFFLLVITGGVSEIFERGQKYFLSSYGRDQESEADQIAIRLLSRDGYDLTGLSRILTKMSAYDAFIHKLESIQAGEVENWFASHPTSTARISVLETLIAEEFGQTTTGRLARDKFLTQIDNLHLYVDPLRGTVNIHITFLDHDRTLADLVDEAGLTEMLDFLQVLNALDPNETISAGTSVKLVKYTDMAE